MKPLQADGILLRRTDYGEADRIITFLTNTHGKIRVMAKGVRKPKSKVAGGIELFSVSELQFIRGRGSVGTLMSARLREHYGAIVKDLERTEAAYGMLRNIDRILEDDTGQDYFGVLHESLAALGDKRIRPSLAQASFVMRVLQEMGHMPDFATGRSGQRLDPDAAYNFDFEATAFEPAEEGRFNKNHIKVLKLLAHNSPNAMAAVQGIYDYINELTVVYQPLAAQYIPN